jgi:hypothetical protein
LGAAAALEEAARTLREAATAFVSAMGGPAARIGQAAAAAKKKDREMSSRG